MANDKFGPGFRRLDGCNMDNDFGFSFYHTRDEWEAEDRRFERIAKSIEQEEAERSLLRLN
jgi:hypothetical protein